MSKQQQNKGKKSRYTDEDDEEGGVVHEQIDIDIHTTLHN